MTRQKNIVLNLKKYIEKFTLSVRCPRKIDIKCPTNFWLGQTSVLPSQIIIASQIIICRPGMGEHAYSITVPHYYLMVVVARSPRNTGVRVKPRIQEPRN
jgi:hypothetical protein